MRFNKYFFLSLIITIPLFGLLSILLYDYLSQKFTKQIVACPPLHATTPCVFTDTTMLPDYAQIILFIFSIIIAITVSYLIINRLSKN